MKKLLITLLSAGSLLAFGHSATACENGGYYSYQNERVWVPQRCERVWIPAKYGWERCHGRWTKVIVRQGYHSERHIPGYWTVKRNRVWVESDCRCHLQQTRRAHTHKRVRHYSPRVNTRVYSRHHHNRHRSCKNGWSFSIRF